MRYVAIPLLWAFSWSWYLQPAFLRCFWGNVLGCLFKALSLRAKVVRQNLELAYPGSENAEKRDALFSVSYRHLGNLVIEILMLFGPMRRNVLARTTFLGVEHWRAAKAKGKGAIILASHVGNWEVMAASGAVLEKIDIMLVTKHLKPEWLHQAVEKGRSRCDVGATYEPRTLKDVLGHLRKNGTVGIVLDQYAGPPIGVRVPVFGTPVGTSTAIAALAKRTGAPVLPAVNHRDERGHFTTEIMPAVEWVSDPDPNRELALNTARYAAILERHIRAYPDQWLWTHRRFKGDLSPLDEAEWSEGRARR